jgi:hypothetical protein
VGSLSLDLCKCFLRGVVMDGVMGCLLVNDLDDEISNILIIFDHENHFDGGVGC